MILKLFLFKNTKLINQLLFLIKSFLFIVFISYQSYSQVNEFYIPKNSTVIIDSLQKIKYNKPEIALRFAYQILERYPLNINDKTIQSVYNIIGEIFVKKGRSIQALEYFIEAEREAKRLGIGDYWILMNMGNVYFQEKKWIKAEEKYFEAYEAVVKRIKHDGPEKINVMSLSLLNRAMIYIELEEYEKSFNLIIQSLELRKKRIKDSLNKYIEPNYGNISYNYLKLIDLYIKWDMLDYAMNSADSCYHYLEKYKIQRSINHKVRKISYMRYNGLLFQSKGRIQILKNNFKKGLEFYNKADKELDNWPIDKVNNYFQISDVFNKQDKLYKALEYIDEGLLICKVNNLKLQELELLQKKSDIFQQLKISKSALEIEQLIKNKIIAINKSRIDDNIKNMELKGELYSSRNLLIGVKEKINFLIFFLGIVFVFLGIIILYIRNKNMQAEQLAIILKQKEKFSKELILSKENELVQMSTFLVSKNEMINTISKDLDYHISLVKDKIEKKSFNPLIKKIKNELSMSNDWLIFQKQFANLYPNFISILTNQHDGLSSNDIKICCYLKMNQTTKDIAQLTGLSIRAIENRRYRLRKKLKLDKNCNLLTYLYSLKI